MPTAFTCVSASVLFAGAAPGFLSPSAQAGTIYLQANLTSNGAVPAANTDPNLINPWGIAFSATSPFWISDQGSGDATLYSGAGVPNSLVVNVPGGGVPPSGPSGQVFNSAPAGSFLVSGTSAKFLFDTLSGTIDGWNAGTSAAVEATSAGAVYTGLAQDSVGASYYLYAANSAGTGSVDVYNASFSKITPAGGFMDPNAITGYVPFNVQNIGGNLYVEYAELTPAGAAVAGSTGYVDEFDAAGNFIARVTTGGHLDAPWGIALAPAAGFGSFSGDLLVGNFGNGEINAFNPTTGAYQGTLSDGSGNPIVNQNLWALDFGNGGAGFSSTTLYFTAGVNNQAGGLFGSLSVSTPEPASLLLTAAGLMTTMALAGLTSFGRKQR